MLHQQSSPSPPAAARLPAAAGGHLKFLDGIRALAAVFVVLHHMWQASFSDYRGGPLPWWWKATTVFSWGHYAVAVFIVLSGFCLMLPVARSGGYRLPGGTAAYLKRRARRILPPYYAALAIALVGIALIPTLRADHSGIYSLDHRPDMAGAIVSHLLLMHNLKPQWAFRLDDPMWSVATEWQIYFLFPWILLPLARKLGMLPLICLSFGLGTATLKLCPACFWYVGLFAAGMGAANISVPNAASMAQRPVRWGLFSAVLGVAGLACLCVPRLSQWPPLGDWFIGCATACFLVHAARRHCQERPHPLAVRCLSSRALVLLGTFSYSVYLIHYPLVTIFESWLAHAGFGTPMCFLGLSIVGLPTIILVSYAFHRVFERPFMKTPSRPARPIVFAPRPVPAMPPE